MRKLQLLIILFLSFFIISCNENIKKKQKIINFESNTNIIKLETDFIKWWSYYNNYVSLSSNFIGIDKNSTIITKELFLNKLTSGNFIPIKSKSINGVNQYMLNKLSAAADKNIVNTIKSEALINLKHYKMEGQHFPKFDFIDLKGNHFTNKNTKGKITIIKTWFINCKACVAEFPELNKFVEKNKNNKNILFMSLVLDSKTDINKFLKMNKFKYQVIPEQKDFITNKLNLNIYPTHIIINKDGTILKVVNKASEMISFLENYK